MDSSSFMDKVNSANLWLGRDQQIAVERFKAKQDGNEYHIVIEFSQAGDRMIVKDIFKPKSFDSSSLYKCQEAFFTKLDEDIFKIGLINLIKNKS